MATAQDEFDNLMREKETRAGHPEDDEDGDIDGQSFLDISDSDRDEDTPTASNFYEEDDNPRPSMSQARNTIPLTRYEANTGPKGVISDAQNFRDSHRQHRVSLRNGANGIGAPTPKYAADDTSLSEKYDGSDADDEGMEDQDFMQRWRNSRLKEMQNGDGHLYHKRRKSRTWGGMTTVDGNGYLDAVENSPSDVVVVVYIFDDYSQVSISIEECLRELAQKHLDVRFIKLHFEDAEMEPAGVPALLAYQGSEKFAGLVPIIQEIPDDAELSARTLEHVLKRHKILR